MLPTEIHEFDTFAACNSCPTDTQASRISLLLSSSISRREVLQSEIRGLKRLIAEKQRECDEISKEIQPYLAVRSAVRRIPQEILSYIFISCLPPDRHCAPIDRSRAPLILTRICSLWRDVALTTPQLWTSIRILMPGLPAQRSATIDVEAAQRRIRVKVEAQETLIANWLTRARNRPLSISFSSPPTEDPDMGGAQRLIGATLPFSRYWKTVVMNCDASLLPPSLLSSSTNDFQLLRSLSIYGTHLVPTRGTHRIANWRRNPLLQGPNLQSLALINISEDPTLLSVSWAMLTSLSLISSTQHPGTDASPYRTRILNTLALCPNLVQCDLWMPRPFFHEPVFISGSRPISLPHLLKFHFDDGGCDLTPFLDMLSAPVLQDFRFESSERKTPNSDPRLFLSKVAPTLRKFTTNATNFMRDRFPDLLRACHGVTALTISFGGYLDEVDSVRQPMEDTLLKMLSGDTQNGKFLLPALEELSIEYQASFSEDALLSFILRRQSQALGSQISRLKRVSVVLSRPMESRLIDIEKEIRAFELQEGRAPNEFVEIKIAYSESENDLDSSISTEDGNPGMEV